MLFEVSDSWKHNCHISRIFMRFVHAHLVLLPCATDLKFNGVEFSVFDIQFPGTLQTTNSWYITIILAISYSVIVRNRKKTGNIFFYMTTKQS